MIIVKIRVIDDEQLPQNVITRIIEKHKKTIMNELRAEKARLAAG